MESILTLPTNITPIITNLLMVLSWAVIPKLNPTVLYAEKHSKAISNKLFSLSKNSGIANWKLTYLSLLILSLQTGLLGLQNFYWPCYLCRLRILTLFEYLVVFD